MFGENLKEARKKAKLSQEKVAEYINTSRSNISKYESEALEPNLETLKRLCELYNVSADYIIGLKNEAQSITPTNTNVNSPNITINYK